VRVVCRCVLPVFALLLFAGGEARASGLQLPPAATQGIHEMFSGHADRATELFRKIEADQPEHPLGYMLEAEVIWWKIYCASLAYQYNIVDDWNHSKRPEDAMYLALTDKVTRLAEAKIAKSETAEMELYAGLGYAQRARLHGMRGQRSATAHAGVAGRKHLLRCLELDPDMADADAGLGLYNYYVDTLSSMAKVLRFFMGIPGGDKKVGLKQLERAIAKGQLMSVESRFYMARDLRNYDRDYARAAEIAAPLPKEFPENPLFWLLTGDLQGKLGHNDEAASRLRKAVSASAAQEMQCSDRTREVVSSALVTLGK
jgi:hypothetical protein